MKTQPTFPHVIENCMGEKVIFQRLEPTPDGDRLVGEMIFQPGSGPVFHTHWQQDEGFQVFSGKMGYQVLGQPERYALPGEKVTFPRGQAHRLWAEGTEPLRGVAWVQPANTFLFFISSIFAAQNKAGNSRPEFFDSAYLLTRYRAEYDLTEMPFFVKKVILPVAYQVGRLLGKYRHFNGAPEPLPRARPVNTSGKVVVGDASSRRVLS